MNPWPVARAALHRFWRAALAMALLVACATATGTAVNVLDRGMRRAATQSADAFDLVIGAPGSPTQLVLAAVYLQPEAIPLMDGQVLARIMADPDVAWASPIGFGDQWHGHPLIGATTALITQGTNRTPTEGRPFAKEEEAVIGATVPLTLGDTITPQHGLLERADAPQHTESPYTVVGRLPPTGTPWDGAILVPIESVWEIHGLGNGHPLGPASEVERIGPPWEATPPGIPAVVVKPRTLAAAYQLRARYRTATSTAIFPAEVLTSLFRTLGDVRALLTAMSAATTILVTAAIFLAFAAMVAARSRDHAVLRAIGAPARFILAALWLELGTILTTGILTGLALGWLLAHLAATILGRTATLPIPTPLSWPDAALAATILLGGLLAATLPILLAARTTTGAALKH